MQASARIEMDRGYFEEYFDQWLAHKSQFRSWQRQFAAALLLFGFIVLFFFDFHPYLSLALLIGGIVEVLEFYWYRHNWLVQRMSVRRENSKFIDLRFDASGVYVQGATSRGHMQWAGVRGVIQTPKGLIFSIGDGMIIYLPKYSVLPNSAIPEIVALAAGAN